MRQVLLIHCLELMLTRLHEQRSSAVCKLLHAALYRTRTQVMKLHKSKIRVNLTRALS